MILLTPDAGSKLRRNIVAWHRAGRRPWHGRGRVWTLVRRMLRNLGNSQLLRWKQYMWFDYRTGEPRDGHARGREITLSR